MTHTPTSPPLFTRQDAGLIAAYAALSVGLAWRMGQDLNWDLLNYHLYNAYMLLDGRIARDVHVAGVQSFLNPAADLPLYAAFRFGVPPRLFYSALAAFQGLALFFVHRIAVAVLPQGPPLVRFFTGVLAAVTAALGAGFLSEAGTTTHDNTLAVLVLASLWLVIEQIDEMRAPHRRAIITAGLLAGAGAGMKLALGPIGIGLFAAVCMLPGNVRARLTHVISFGAAAGIGGLLTSGYWMWAMYEHFQSPLFPFYNEIFNSPFAPPQNFADARFLPRSAYQALFYPFYWVADQSLVTEPVFRDARFAAGFLALAALALHRVLELVGCDSPDRSIRSRRLLAVAVFWVVSYTVWLRIFSIYRYVVALEVLTAVLIIGVAARLAPRWTRHLALTLPVCVALSMSNRLPDWGRTPWSDSYFGVDTRALEPYADATLLMWDFPQGYLAPHFPRSATFLRLLSNWGLTGETALWDRVVRTVKNTPTERLFLLDLDLGSAPELQDAALQQLGLEHSDVPCQTYPSYHVRFRLCALRRTSTPSAP